MPESRDFHSEALTTKPRLEKEDISSYTKRMLRLKSKTYSKEERLKLAQVQLELLLDENDGEFLISCAGTDDDTLMVMEMLAATHDYINTFDDINDEYIRMMRQKRQMAAAYKRYLHQRGMIVLKTNGSPEHLRGDINNGEIDPKIRELLRQFRHEAEISGGPKSGK